MITLFPSGYTLSMWIKWKRASEAEKETLSDPFKVLSARQARQINFFKNWFLVRIYFKSLRSTRKVLFAREDFAFFHFFSLYSVCCVWCLPTRVSGRPESNRKQYRAIWIDDNSYWFGENVSGLAEARSASSGSTKRTPNKSVVV